MCAVTAVGGVSAARAGEPLVLEEVVVTAKAPARPELVVARAPAARDAWAAANVESFETTLVVERPRVDLTTAAPAAPARPALSL